MNIKDYKDEIIELYTQGYTPTQISVQVPFEMSEVKSYINSLIGRGELEKNTSRTITSKRDLIKEAWRLGEKDIPTLARRFNVSEKSIVQYLVGEGRGKLPTDKALDIARELAQSEYNCHLFTTIAKKYGVTRQYVKYILINFERYASEL